ncbi:hypothetical protein HHI36_021993 [Cryptolaemus montrouzieri]
MIYENEELRLRTININAEIERGQYDIKKLKRENELLKKEIWCLRDEYEKLDKLLKEKEIDFSSSSTTTSETESCSSCIDESDDVEKSQNLENVQKTNLKILNQDFEALSVVPEESTENSDKNSNRTSSINDLPHDSDIIQADQSYPSFQYNPNTGIFSETRNSTRNFFSLEKLDSKNVLNENASIQSNEYYNTDRKETTSNGVVEDNPQFTSKKSVSTDATHFYQNIVLVPRQLSYTECDTLEKRETDVLVKTDNKNFIANHEPNGGDNGYISQFADDFPRYCSNFGTNSHSTFSNGGNLEELLNDIETISQDILAISNSNQNECFNATRRCKSDINPMENQSNYNQKPFKSELNVTLMPQPMALIGLEKYKDIQRSMNRTPSKSLENLSSQGFHVFHNQDEIVADNSEFHHFQQSPMDVTDFTPNQVDRGRLDSPIPQSPNFQAYLSNLKDNYVNGDYFARYNPANFQKSEGINIPNAKEPDQKQTKPKAITKQTSIDIPSSENEESSKKPRTDFEIQSDTTQYPEHTEKPETKQKVGLRKKVSIHFRGKKEKQKKSLEVPTNSIKKHSPVRDKRAQETKLEENRNDKAKIDHQKTSSRDSNKTTSDSDTKCNPEIKKPENDKKQRKSASVSPDRKKIKEEKKCKKHKRERIKLRRATLTSLDGRDNRARSHSVATERSNTYGGSHFAFDEYMLNSERDSMSSCETLKTRQMHFSNIPISGKVPWCGCWGNGCI